MFTFWLVYVNHFDVMTDSKEYIYLIYSEEYIYLIYGEWRMLSKD